MSDLSDSSDLSDLAAQPASRSKKTLGYLETSGEYAVLLSKLFTID